MLQLQADAMIFVKNRLGKFYEQSTWQIFTNVWQIFTNVWQIFTNVWESFTNVWEIATNVWETQCPGKIVSVFLSNKNLFRQKSDCDHMGLPHLQPSPD